MNRGLRFSLIIVVLISVVIGAYLIFRSNYQGKIESAIEAYSGSESCRPCHEKFYELWAPSHHGTAMQAVTSEFIQSEIKNSSEDIIVGQSVFNVINRGDSLLFTETFNNGETVEYTALHALGGKYIFYFLTEFERGRLHVLPLAYDCKTESWYNNPESGVRHFESMENSALDWKNYLYTFNTSCYGCHVSQLNSNFDLEDLSYTTTWTEPGINCETCHGPSAGHVRACAEADEGEVPEDLEIIITGTFTPDQHDASCGSCHAKSSIVAPGYPPGERFYDYFSLVTLESPDYYADARDLGENYTMTSWAMNICQQSSDLHCVSCHTSSGRYRFAGENPNQACAPCHNKRIENVSDHSNHKEDSEGSKCIACHMPKTTFARMDRSDHSFRPPMPEASIAFGSPNACNICHNDKTPEWANREIKKTHSREYQEKTISAGMLIREARDENWDRLGEIVEGLKESKFDEIYTTSFIRLLDNCQDDLKWEGILSLTSHSSPLVRSSAAHSLALNGSTEAYEHLVKLAADDFRAVRIRAAYSLASYSNAFPQYNTNPAVASALEEYLESEMSRPDSWSAHYNLGNYYSNLMDYDRALESYNNAIRIYPEAIMPMVNAGYIFSVIGDIESAELMFERALSYEPDHEAALLNLALLYGEAGKVSLAIDYYKRLMTVSEKNAVAAFNLSILLSESQPEESLAYIEDAFMWAADNMRYAYTYGFFLNRSGNTAKAKSVLNNLIKSSPEYFDAYLLLGNIYINDSQNEEARRLLNDAIKNENFNPDQKQGLLSLLKTIGE